MKYKISKGNLPTVDISLDDKEEIFSESGGMAWMTNNIEMTTSTKGGILKGIGRMLGGESLFLVTFKSNGAGRITFASEFPGEIKAIELKENQSIIVQKDSFLCATEKIDVKMHFRKKLGTGLFGGEGFILQEITGPGTVFLEIDGESSLLTLKANEVIKVDTGHIVMYDPGVKYDLTMVKGFKNIFFGGEGLFLASLTGPGNIILQSMPVRNLAKKLLKYMPRPSGGGKGSGINFGNFMERS